jgi:hypothetical protein
MKIKFGIKIYSQILNATRTLYNRISKPVRIIIIIIIIITTTTTTTTTIIIIIRRRRSSVTV